MSALNSQSHGFNLIETLMANYSNTVKSYTITFQYVCYNIHMYTYLLFDLLNVRATPNMANSPMLSHTNLEPEVVALEMNSDFS